MIKRYTCHMGGHASLDRGDLYFQDCGEIHILRSHADQCSKGKNDSHREQEWLKNMDLFAPVMKLIHRGVESDWMDPDREIEDADLP